MQSREVERHLLEDRKVQPERYNVLIDEEDGVAFFLIWTLSGKLVGYQQYRPSANKEQKNHPKTGRYFTYAVQEGELEKHKSLTVWGLESLDYRDDILFVLEGTFKCIPFHNRGWPAIATLSNNAKQLRNLLYILSQDRRIIVVGDNDDGGSATRSNGYELFFPPPHVKDVDDLTDEEFDAWLKGVLSEQQEHTATG